MKFYKFKIIQIILTYLLLFFLSSVVFLNIRNLKMGDLFFIIPGYSSVVFIVIWTHLLTLIINDKGIFISLMFKNKVIKNLKKLKWNEIWFVDCRNQKYHITLVPKRETKEFQRFKWDELFIISSNYEKFSEIRETIIKNAPDAKVLPFNDKAANNSGENNSGDTK